MGPVYPIAEQNMLETIEQRLQTMEKSGELARIEEDAKSLYRNHVERPEGVHLPGATQNRTYYVDPSITVPFDIKDHDGRIIHYAGTSVNPLDHMTLSEKLLFFDGDDPIQVEWARGMVDSDPLHIKPILINGPVLLLMEKWRIRLYFDQRGQLSERFGILGVPAVIFQDKHRLRVVEYSLGAKE